ncbi:hypothetical protein T08_16372 [Trichinella sp. T8]|nr:hypothetical protein T08_16372 [Trichinella sp. T8]
MQNNFPNLIAQAKRNISHHLKTPENSKSPCFLESRNLRSSCQNITGRAVILPSPWEGSLALQGGSLFGLSILLLLYVFHVPLRACFPFHGTSLRCVFNSYRDDGHRFIAARWEISQCQYRAYGNQLVCSDVMVYYAKFLCCGKLLTAEYYEQFIMKIHSWSRENNPTWNVGRGALCKISVLQKISRYGVMAAAPDKQRTMAEGVEIVMHHSIHWHGSGKSIDTWNLGGPVVFSMPLWNVLPSVET